MIRSFAAFCALVALVFSAATPAADAWQEGKNYFVVTPAQRTTVPPGKVEVTEVFSLRLPVLLSDSRVHPEAEGSAAAERPAGLSTRRRSSRVRTGRCSSARTSLRRLWVSKRRPTRRCSTRVWKTGELGDQRSADQSSQDHDAEPQRCGSVLRKDRGSEARDVPRPRQTRSASMRRCARRTPLSSGRRR